MPKLLHIGFILNIYLSGLSVILIVVVLFLVGFLDSLNCYGHFQAFVCGLFFMDIFHAV